MQDRVQHDYLSELYHMYLLLSKNVLLFDVALLLPLGHSFPVKYQFLYNHPIQSSFAAIVIAVVSFF